MAAESTRRFQKWRRLAGVLIAIIIASSAHAQDVVVPVESKTDGTQPAAPTGTPASEPPATSTIPALPSIAELSAQRLAIPQDPDLDEATRTLLDQQLSKTIENIQAAEHSEARTMALVKELESLPQRLADLQQRIGIPLKEDVVPPDADSVQGLDALMIRLKEAESAVAALRQKAQETTDEVDRRSARRPQLAELKNQANLQLQEVGQLLLAPMPEGEAPSVMEVKTTRLQSRLLRSRREIALLEQESRTYEGTTRQWTLQRDLAERDVQEADRIVQYWQKRTADARRIQAEEEAAAARQAMALSHESVRKEAELNREFADENTRIVELRQETRSEIDRIEKDLKTRTQEFESLQERSEAADFSPAIGMLLRKQRSTLPDRHEMRVRISDRQSEISRLNLQLLEWEAERRPLIDISATAAKIISKLESPPESISAAELQEQVQVILAARYQRLGDLIENGKALLVQLVDLDGQEKRLLDKVDEESLWLAEHVLWVRSTGLIGTQPQTFVNSVTAFADRQTWQRVGNILWQDLVKNGIGWSIFVLTVVTLLFLRVRAKRSVHALGEIAARSNCVDIMPTVKAMVLSVFVASPLPTAVYCFGLRFEQISSGEITLWATGIALQVTAVAWFIVDFLRQMSQPDGLGDSHFEWAESSMISIRRTMRFLLMTAIPPLLILVYTESLADEQMVSSIGRIAYLVGMGWLWLAAFRLVRPDSPILQSLENEHAGDVLWKTRWIWSGLLLASPILLSLLSVAGFHYTAVQLTERVAATIGCGLAALSITAFLSRWLLVNYRKLAIQRGRERRQQMLQAAQAEPDQPIPQDTTPSLRLADINDQTSRLLRLSATVGMLMATYLIWIDVLPALGILGKIELWPNSLETGIGIDDLSIKWVTAADAMFALLIGVLTLIASRNIPGLMEIVILQRLPLDAGARYAASTVSRYLIVVTGFLFGFRAIGIGWSSVQWLLAAVTVGLGFGLQEIFANFVSGIILLFERPIRVGDTVTVSDITGTVTRIQIRATTILDWDNKELIVPNREFVTGNLVNWTLTNPTLRLVVKVGVAYGSDTRLATKLLYRVAEENSQVLEEPEPVVIFNEFGDSSLNFDLRLYVSGLLAFRRLKHELHTAIDDLFREHKIEIAFPQRDLHVRSIPAEMMAVPRSVKSPTLPQEDLPIDQIGATLKSFKSR